MDEIQHRLDMIILDWQERLEKKHPYLTILQSDRRELADAILSALPGMGKLNYGDLDFSDKDRETFKKVANNHGYHTLEEVRAMGWVKVDDFLRSFLGDRFAEAIRQPCPVDENEFKRAEPFVDDCMKYFGTSPPYKPIVPEGYYRLEELEVDKELIYASIASVYLKDRIEDDHFCQQEDVDKMQEIAKAVTSTPGLIKKREG